MTERRRRVSTEELTQRLGHDGTKEEPLISALREGETWELDGEAMRRFLLARSDAQDQQLGWTDVSDLPYNPHADYLLAVTKRLRSALELIDRNGCTNLTRGRCWDTNSRQRGAKYGADAWCDACVARDALGPEE